MIIFNGYISGSSLLTEKYLATKCHKMENYGANLEIYTSEDKLLAGGFFQVDHTRFLASAMSSNIFYNLYMQVLLIIRRSGNSEVWTFTFSPHKDHGVQLACALRDLKITFSLA